MSANLARCVFLCLPKNTPTSCNDDIKNPEIASCVINQLYLRPRTSDLRDSFFPGKALKLGNAISRDSGCMYPQVWVWVWFLGASIFWRVVCKGLNFSMQNWFWTLFVDLVAHLNWYPEFLFGWGWTSETTGLLKKESTFS